MAATCHTSRLVAAPQPAKLGRTGGRALPGAGSARPCPRMPSRRVACEASVSTPKKLSRMDEFAKQRNVLVEKNVKSVSPEEALRLVRMEGYKILDVRPEGDYKEVHPEGAVNAQVFRLIKEWTPYDIARRAGFAFFGVFNGTEDNPEFLEEVARVASKDDKLIVACSMGGTLKPTQNFPLGKESRSLTAAYFLVTAGYKNVLHMEEGLNGYFKRELPLTFKDD